eukprot:3041078-Pleurochrysis_carterae.AAC.1
MLCCCLLLSVLQFLSSEFNFRAFSCPGNVSDPHRGWHTELATYLCPPRCHSWRYVPVGNGRCVLLTGCDTGFGRIVAQLALDAGFKVVAACYTEAGAATFASTTATIVVADLTTAEGVER